MEIAVIAKIALIDLEELMDFNRTVLNDLDLLRVELEDLSKSEISSEAKERINFISEMVEDHYTLFTEIDNYLLEHKPEAIRAS
ncbi:MAG: hypothetical protein HXY50_00505 [Ignavibacteriaceae bacterium]|nr:hypothetical protein [Ignavibacteriaceae bacterium]